MGVFGRKKSDAIGRGRDAPAMDDEAPLSVAVPNDPVRPPSEDPDAPPPPADAAENLEALIRETAGGRSATGRSRLSRGEKRERSRIAKETRAALKAERLAARASARDAVASKGGPLPGRFSFGRRKAVAVTDEAEQIDLIVGEPDTRMSMSVVIEFLQGYAKEDAITWAKRWAMDKMAVPSDCYYFVMKYPGGYAVEVQEGVGQAYLPSAVSLATSNPGRMVVVPMSRRKMTVRYTERTDDYEAYVLPEGQEPPVTGTEPLFARRTARMKPIMQQNLQWLYAGAATSGIGGLFLIGSLLLFALDPSAKVPPEWRTTAVSRLPVMQWGRLQPDATDSYVVRMEFADGQWRIIRQAAGATAEVTTLEGGPEAGIVGGAVAAPSSPDSSIPPPPPPGVVVTPVPTQIPPPSASGR